MTDTDQPDLLDLPDDVLMRIMAGAGRAIGRAASSSKRLALIKVRNDNQSV